MNSLEARVYKFGGIAPEARYSEEFGKLPVTNLVMSKSGVWLDIMPTEYASNSKDSSDFAEWFCDLRHPTNARLDFRAGQAPKLKHAYVPSHRRSPHWISAVDLSALALFEDFDGEKNPVAIYATNITLHAESLGYMSARDNTLNHATLTV